MVLLPTIIKSIFTRLFAELSTILRVKFPRSKNYILIDKPSNWIAPYPKQHSEMKEEREFITLVLLFFVNFARSDVLKEALTNVDDPCINLCEDTRLSTFTNSTYVKSCCQRGCRFFNLVELRYGELNSIRGTRDACKTSCTEAYTVPQDRSVCNIGCTFMATQRVLLSLLNVATIHIKEGVDSNILLMSPDIPENDILTDPGLRKELLPGWWDSDGFKLPQTYIKTVPLDAGTVDYGIPSDYSGENDQSASIPGSDWLQCASRHTGIPHWLLALTIAAAALSAFWLCLSPEKNNDPFKEILIEKSDISPKVTLYVPDEAPLHKQPPPKYVDTVNGTVVDMKV